jgi:hypothetical protein
VKTDIPLKVLTMQHGADLLPLFGMPSAELVRVETIELPATRTRLDNVLHIRSPNGQEYLLVVEWQGYTDKAILATPPQQNNLLSILTTFSEPWMSTEQILRLVGKERLMESKIWNTLLAEAMDEVMEKKEEEYAQKLASVEEAYKTEVEAYKAKESEWSTKLYINELQQTLENALITRFPQAPVRLMRDIRQVSQSSQFNDLIVALVAVQDVEGFEQKLQEILHASKN